MSNKRVSDNLAVYTGELLLALSWIEEVKSSKVLIGSDSSSALTSIESMQSHTTQDRVPDIAHTISRIKKAGIEMKFMWIPAHIGVDRNELADKHAKYARKREISMVIKCSKAEIKSIIKAEMKKKWQKEWDRGNEYYSIQRRVGEMRGSNRNRKEDGIILRHTHYTK